MRRDVRVIRGALEGDVQSDLQSEPARRRHDGVEISQRTERRVHRRVPTQLRPDGPRAARIFGIRGE
jgi:hypothetical protein